MEFINRTSQSTNLETIIRDLTENITDRYDLGILFLSQQDKGHIRNIVEHYQEIFSVKYLIGCTCAGVIGSQKEIEHQPAASLTLAKLPSVRINFFSLNQVQLEQMTSKPYWYRFFEIFPNEHPVFIIFPDPCIFDMTKFLNDMNHAYPKCPIIGGMASATSDPGGNLLILNDEILKEGVVGVILTGNITTKSVVSQGCRPVGKSFIITKAEDNVIYEIAGKKFIHALQDTLNEIHAQERTLAEEALFVGIALNEYLHPLKRGDFLIRGVLGIDAKTGAGVIADTVRKGQTIQFHVRDAHTASEDLNSLLKDQLISQKNLKPKGALVFSCNGRGEYLFREKNHDIKTLQHHLGPMPAGGFFCAGEIGPIGGKNFLHGFTDSIALFYPRT